jgi:hypothetical protein
MGGHAGNERDQNLDCLEPLDERRQRRDDCPRNTHGHHPTHVRRRRFLVCAPGQNTIMFGWNAKTPGGETFGDIYREQYRQQRARPGLRAAAGLALPLGGGFWLFGHHVAITFIVFGVAVVLLVAAVVLGRRERRAGSTQHPRRLSDVVDETSSAGGPPPA